MSYLDEIRYTDLLTHILLLVLIIFDFKPPLPPPYRRLDAVLRPVLVLKYTGQLPGNPGNVNLKLNLNFVQNFLFLDIDFFG